MRTRRLSVISGEVSSNCTSSTANALESCFEESSASPRIRFSTATSLRSAAPVSVDSIRRITRDSWYRSEHSNDVPARCARVNKFSRVACRTDSKTTSISFSATCDDVPVSSPFRKVCRSDSFDGRSNNFSFSSSDSSLEASNESWRRALIFRDTTSGTSRSLPRSSRFSSSFSTAASNCFNESLHKLRAANGSPGVTPTDGACDTHAKKNASNTSAFAS
mmetsp:Transcript_11600/g.42965  ORF Transcript_11600/g.42965 Transcript_11600/m.42965 type:complete len:220 (-) Transcript_11600:440-1099(-)